MQIIRTLLWIVLTGVLVAFIAINWTPVQVNIWPVGAAYYNVQWPVGFLVLIAFALGMAPMWLLHRASRWRLGRRIATLENSLRAVSVSVPVAAEPAAETSQLDPSV